MLCNQLYYGITIINVILTKVKSIYNSLPGYTIQYGWWSVGHNIKISSGKKMGQNT